MSPLMKSNNIAARMGRWSASHWKTAVFGWVAFVILAVVAGGMIGTKQIDQRDSNTGQAHKADQILKQAGFQADPQTEIVLVQSKTQTIHDAAFRATIADVIATVKPFSAEYKNLRSPLGHPDQVTADGRTAMVEFDMRGTQKAAEKRIDKITAATGKIQGRRAGFFVGEAGSISSGKALNDAFNSQIAKAGERSIPLTLLILLIVFGSLVAAGIPLLLALSAVAATLGLVSIPSHLVPMDPNVSAVVLLVGLAVGVDYALFYLKREREERAAGAAPRAALEAAAATSGRSVLISGLTVMVAMAGMLFAQDRTYLSFGISTMTVVAVAMLGSLTVLPALLSKLGDRVEWGRLPFLGKNRESRFWRAALRPALRYPKITVVGAVALLLAIAAPALHMHTRDDGVSDAPQSLPVVKAYKKVTKAFGTTSAPAVVVVHAPNIDAPSVRSGIAALRRDVHRPVKVIPHANDTVELDVPLAGNGADATSLHGLQTLRSRIIPSTIGAVPGVEVAVTGETAGSADFTSTIDHHMPLVLGFVFLLTLALMLLCFRSLTVGLTAIALNMLSVAAAYGAMTWVFQDGHGHGLLGFQSSGAIVPWVPLFLFAVLFGLSMDYHVFIVSRIRELVDRGYSTREAVDRGIRSTASTVTSAALVMVGVFAVFATLGLLSLKQMGFGLAVAVLIDATVIRALLLPATMTLLGERNWWLPRALARLPRLNLAAEGA